MKYFLPDSQDLVDPSFDFERERRSVTRLRQRDDFYAHEVFKDAAFDGILVSKGIVDGSQNTGGRYTLAQRHRLLREGAREFFRLDRAGKLSLPTMGDCGAFTYLKEKDPPYSVDDVLRFYVECGFDYGISGRPRYPRLQRCLGRTGGGGPVRAARAPGDHAHAGPRVPEPVQAATS